MEQKRHAAVVMLVGTLVKNLALATSGPGLLAARAKLNHPNMATFVESVVQMSSDNLPMDEIAANMLEAIRLHFNELRMARVMSAARRQDFARELEVILCMPDTSDATHQKMVDCVLERLDKLVAHYSAVNDPVAGQDSIITGYHSTIVQVLDRMRVTRNLSREHIADDTTSLIVYHATCLLIELTLKPAVDADNVVELRKFEDAVVELLETFGTAG